MPGSDIVSRCQVNGAVEFRESDELKVLVNISSPSIEGAYAVQASLLDHRGELLIQVHEKNTQLTPVTLQWIIISIGSLTGIVMVCAACYAIWWYCTHQISDTVNDRCMYYNISQPVIQRSRNSVQTGSQGEATPFGDEDHDNIHNEDTLRGVPEMPEEEAEATQRDAMHSIDHHTDDDEDSDENNDCQIDDQAYVKNRYQSPAKRLYKDRPKTDRKTKRRLFPSATQPPSYDSIMEYPEETEPAPIVKKEYRYQGHQMSTFHSPSNPFKRNIEQSLNHSDGDLLKNPAHPDRMCHLPTSTYSSVSPTQVHTEITPGELTRSERLQNVKMNGTTNAIDGEDPTPFMVSAMVHRPNMLSPSGSSFQDFRSTKIPPQRSKTVQDQDSGIHTMDHHQMNIPLTTFKSPLKTLGRTCSPKFQSDDQLTSSRPHKNLDEGYANRQYSYGRKVPPNFNQSGFDPLDLPPALTRAERISATSYDSSELFDDSHIHGLSNVDEFDLDNYPPIELDPDVSSDVSLPLPTPPLEVTEPFNFDPSAFNNQGSLPRHFTQLPSEDLDNMSGTFIAATGSPHHSPEKGMFVWTGTPSGTLERPQRMDKGTSGIPPPPKVYSPPQNFSWTKEKLITDLDEEVTDGPVSSREGGVDGKKHNSLGRKKGGSMGATHLHMTVLILSIICLTTGVFCAVSPSDTKVNIVVFAPANILSNGPSVYFNLHEPIEIVAPGSQVNAYETKEPILRDMNSTLCFNHTCVHGCDENTGECVCLKGYRIQEHGTCVDVNECIEGGVDCHSTAGCINTKGSYNCFCVGPDYYGDGKTCSECTASCKHGTYEYQPCSNNTDKICTECLDVCADGYYEIYACTFSTNTVCRTCQPKCGGGEYEFRDCAHMHNRICRSKTELSTPESSSNVILVDEGNSTELNVEISFLPSDFDGTRRFLLKRDHGVLITVVVRHMNPVAMFLPVNHSDSNDLSTYNGRAELLQRQCPFPVPSHYDLSYHKHQNMTYMNKNGHLQACQTFTKYGSFPEPRSGEASEHSITCGSPGPLSKVFLLDPQFESTSVVWAENSLECEWNREKCENCTRNCARHMALSNSPECSISDSESDNGWSPRLPTCYSCCVSENCTGLCRDHNNLNCRTERCVNGNLVEFKLKPVFIDDNKFYCHVTPTLNQHLIELEYTVSYYNTQLFKDSFTLRSDEQWQKTGKIHQKDKFLNVEVDTKLTSIPDFLEFSLSSPNIRVGKYHTSGPRVEHSVVRPSSVKVRPLKPFGISPYQFGNQSCDDEILKDVVIATELEGPYDENTELLALQLGDRNYAVTNKSIAPHIRIWIEKDQSILKNLYPDTRLLEDSFLGNMDHNSTHWIVNVSGELQSCPGRLRVNVSEIGYPFHPVFHYEIVVTCPPVFNLSFGIPTGDSPGHEKDMVVSVGDVDTVYHLTLHKPAASWAGSSEFGAEQAMGLEGTTEEETSWDPPMEPPHFSVPFVASVCGAIVLLLFLATFGILLSSDLPEGDVLRVKCCHLLVMVGYITIQFMYALLVTGSVFVLILLAINSDTVMFLKNYHQQRSVKTAFSQLELDHMQLHLTTEINRQNQIANQTKDLCEQRMRTVITDISNIRKKLEMETKSVIDKKSLHHLISLHTREVLQQFSHSLNRFRERYDRHITYTLRKLAADIEVTYDSISNNKWLVGPKFIHGTMANIRTLLSNRPSKPFMEWAGLDTDLSKLTSDLSLPLPPLPSFNDILQDDMGKWNSGKRDTSAGEKPIKPIFRETHNMWFYPDQDLHDPQNETMDMDELHSDRGRSKLSMKSYYVFFGLMVFLDIVMFLHRILKSLGVCNLLLYGYPVYVDLRGKTDMTEEDTPTKQNSSCAASSCLTIFSYFLKKVMATFLIPKVIAMVSICLLVYIVSVLAHNFVNRDTFGYLGYYNNMDDLLHLHENAVNSQIRSHADHVNQLEYPTHEMLMNSYINRQQYLITMHEHQWEGIRTAHEELHCAYMKKMDDSVHCVEQRSQPHEVTVDGCTFPPVIPQTYQRSSQSESTIAENQMDAFLHSIRKLISDTCYVVLIYMSVVVIKELLGVVVWVFMKRAGLLNLRIIYETSESQSTSEK
ncbi:hypothetical protein ScPMuIL_018945 [Solemya velum]